MSVELATQIRDYALQVEAAQAPLTVDEVMELRVGIEPVRPIASRVGHVRTQRRSRGVLVAVAAAAVILLLVGGVAWLSRNEGVPPANEPATTVPSETTIPSETTVPTDTSIPPPTPTTTEALAAVPPGGEGPQLEFVRVEVPGGESDATWYRGGVWFNDALYAIGVALDGDSTSSLYRSVDGFDWELLSSFSDVDNGSERLLTDGDLLVFVGMDRVDGSRLCGSPGDAIVVHTSVNGVDWATSRIEGPLPGRSGCYSVSLNGGEGVAGVAVGPAGIMVSALLQGEISAETIFEAEFGLYPGTDPDDPDREITLVEGSYGDGILEFTSAEGDIYTIDLEAAGYLDDIEAFLRESGESDASSRALDGTWFTGRGLAWFSPDGQTWSQLGASGPLDGGEIAAVVATPDGFVATSTSSGSPGPPGPAQDVLWETTDGTTWTQRSTLSDSHLSGSPHGLDMWDGRLVAVMRKGVWTIEDTPQQLITANMGVMEIGEFGLVGVRSEVEDGGTEMIFSADGTTWNRWTPPEFGPEGTIYVVGIADEFVVLQLVQFDETTQTSDGSLWVGTLP